MTRRNKPENEITKRVVKIKESPKEDGVFDGDGNYVFDCTMKRINGSEPEENTVDILEDDFNDDINENKPDKHVLLARYLVKPVTKFKQYDCFIRSNSDDKFRPDKDGDCLFSGNTHELMRGASVRVLIRPDEREQDVIRALLKITEVIRQSGGFNDIPF